MEFEGGCGSILGSLWEHLRHMGLTLESLWGYFGISLESNWISVGDFGLLDGHFAIIVESLWVIWSTLDSLWGCFGLTFGIWV